VGFIIVGLNPETNKEINTVTIVTTEANELMAEIHNTKHRMPILLNKQNQFRWLDDIPLEEFTFPNYDPVLDANNFI